MRTIPILDGLSEIAHRYDMLICDVWGVLHNGREAYRQAADALRRFRADCGPVVLLTNAPRPVADLEAMFVRLGVPLDCYDAIITSGIAARADLANRIEKAARAFEIFHLGPERDRGVFEGLNVACVESNRAEIVLCTGLLDDDAETPDDYTIQLEEMRSRGLTMLCANPDIAVQRGDKLVWCAGALAEAYEKLGGEAVYFGKPYSRIYEMSLAAGRSAAGRDIRRPLAIGDGVDTDIEGARRAGIDAVFVANGVHAAQMGESIGEGVGQLFAAPKARPIAAMRALVW